MDKIFVLLLNRGAPEYYPGEMAILKDPDFFQNGHVFCWYNASGGDPVLYCDDPTSKRFLTELSKNGLLLVYDGVDLDEVDHIEIGNILSSAIPPETTIYVCCHANKHSMPLWETVVKEQLGDRLAGWVTFHNDQADKKSEVIHGFFKGERNFLDLVTEVFRSAEDRDRVKFFDVLKQVVIEARQTGDIGDIGDYLKDNLHLSAGQKEEMVALLIDIDLQEHADGPWHTLFNYLDELS